MYGFLRPRTRCDRRALAPHQCGLCGRLGADYRPRARWLAGWDPTLLAALVEALAPDAAPRATIPCPIPLARRREAIDPAWPPLRAIAAAQVFLAGEKLWDDRVDRDGVLPRLAARLLAREVADASDALAAAGFPLDTVRAALRAQPEVERDPAAGLDALASPTAHALGEVLAFAGAQAGVGDLGALRRLGARLGRALHLVDALADLRRDRAEGRFNPIAHVAPDLTPARVAWIAGALEGRLTALAEAFDALPLRRAAPAVRAALVDGLAARGREALARLPAPRSVLAVLEVAP